MKIIVISDTHGFHDKLELPLDADMIIHAGDVSGRGTTKEIINFMEWYDKLPYKYKIFIAGNHDFFMESKYMFLTEKQSFSTITYLCDELIEIEGIKIYGSPYQPEFHSWAFNLPRGIVLKEKWDLIPEGIDILITHGPPYGILDKTLGDVNAGCEDLRNRIAIVKPKYHIFGHIHEARGTLGFSTTKFINATSIYTDYSALHPPYIIEI